MNRIKNFGLILARPDIFFFSLIWLMVLLVLGTVAQKYVGLYQAQITYFSSFILWVGPIPLPGGFAVMALMFINLLAKLIFASPWRLSHAGIIITHLGALLLLLGGFMTAVYSQEGDMVIYEGQGSNFFSDYHERELVVLKSLSQKKILSFPWQELQTGKVFKIPQLGLGIEILKKCRVCNVFQRKILSNDPILKELRGHAKDFDMEPLPLEKEDENSQSGVLFKISGAGEERDGIHMSFDFSSASPWFDIEGERYTIALQRVRTYLPFKIKLIDFEKQFHPGTDIARSFKSEILLMDGNAEWHSLVQMNEPLRYKGYTFFQSSFIDTGSEEATVFAVVKNAGRMFPYISSIMMCLGLLVHMSLNIPKLMRKE